jgi:outer membrane protein
MAAVAMAGAAAVLVISALAPAAEEKPRALKVGVVDVDRVFRDYKRNDDESKRLEEKYKARFEELAKKEESLREDERRLAVDAGETPNLDQLKRRQELQYRRAELGVEERRMRAERSAERVKALNSLWSDVLNAAARYGKDKGYDLLIKQQIDPETPKAAEDFARGVASRTVLFQVPNMDCTADLLKALNAEYDRGGHGTEKAEKSKKE